MKHTRTATALAAALLATTGPAASPSPATTTAGTTTTAAAAVAPASAGRTATAGRVFRLDGVRVSPRRGTRQVVTVNRTAGHHARVTFWRWAGDGWRRQLTTTDGRIGYGGLVRGTRRVQGSGATPLGTYRLPWAFGMHPQRAAWDPSYRKVRPGDYWVLDNSSRHYNTYRNRSRGGFRWRLPSSHPDSSERLLDYRQQYEWAIVTSFNNRRVRHRGGAIFLHVNGSGATAGCVSAPRWFIRRAVGRLDPDRAPVIAIGR